MKKQQTLVEKCINTVRVLSADAVQKANSGHPGTPMALAPVGHVFWSDIMNYNPANPDWANRDRFILSCGHACMLQYSYLFLTGYAITLQDLKNFRQLHSRTAGHPEYGLLPGIEVTTGPLGQGFANGVGMAIGQKYLASRYNKPGMDLFDYKIYGLCSDGDLMEGVCAETASIAGHLELGNIIYIYDNNHITIEGKTGITYTEDVDERFKAYGWHVQFVEDGNNIDAIKKAIEKAKRETKKPSLIRVRTLIGYGSPNKVDTAEAHGAPLGADEVKLVKENFGFDPDKYFDIPKEVAAYYKKVGAKGSKTEAAWNKLYQKYRKAYPAEAAEYEQFCKSKFPAGWKKLLPVFKTNEKGMATRKALGEVLNSVASVFPNLIGGSADLAPSTNTNLNDYGSFESDNYGGRNFHFGIREHGMGSILNGISLTKGLIGFGATFLIFSDYMRPPIRLAAIMKIRPIYIFTHDSIGLGEDGTTHQPVEQLIGLRSVPNMRVIRPADANETSHAVKAALEHTSGPVALVLTRQNLPVIDQKMYGKASGLSQGAYILHDTSNKPQLILVGTGSEVHLLLEAQQQLLKDRIHSRVVSMPSWELFEAQTGAYKESIFPKKLRKRLAVEAGSSIGWSKYITDDGAVIGIDKFGESAPGEEVMKEYGFSVANVVKQAKILLKKK